ncbi:MAG: GNAT family N-acetyltransferase [Crocinitomicaceae bacterium]|nr:GNAT family N-acetyltransferase [Crocinitomicaceae bacterium]MBK8925801.1 GNAT family N-acetyltransferase [Crocinitomicaceae bacterium]
MSIQVFSAKLLSSDSIEKDELYSILIKAYAETEDLMWGADYIRISRDDFEKFIQHDQFMVATYNGHTAGGLRVYRIDKDIFSFGTFGVRFDLSGHGIGRVLIAEAERKAIQAGALSMKIEILRPASFEIPIKTKLHHWYTSLGYKITHTIGFEKLYPDKAARLLTPCLFDFYVKNL